MSFIHYTLVGHFDPRRVHLKDYRVSRPLDKERLDALLGGLPPGAVEHVWPQDGYVHCQWAPGGMGVHAFAYRLAGEEGCVAVENGIQVSYPPEATRAQQEEWEREEKTTLLTPNPSHGSAPAQLSGGGEGEGDNSPPGPPS